MSRATRPGSCDLFTPDLSAFLDGELPFPDSLPAIDHLSTCESCRRFYLEARSLAERVVAGDAPAAAGSLWEGVATRWAAARQEIRKATSARRRVWALGLAAAAVLVFGLTLSQRRAAPPPGDVREASVPSTLREIVVEGARGRMTDERFVSLMAELLSADKKYRHETKRVLSLVDRREGPAEPDDLDTTRSEDEAREGEADESSRNESPKGARAPS